MLLRILVGVFLLSSIQFDARSDRYSPEFEKSPEKMTLYENDRIKRIAEERQELFRMRVAIPEAVGDNAINPAEVRRTVEDAQAKSDSILMGTLMALRMEDLCIVAMFIVTGMVAMRLFGDEITSYLNRRFKAWMPVPAMSRVREFVRVEDEAFGLFASDLRTGPQPEAGAQPKEEESTNKVQAADKTQADARAEVDPIGAFFSRAGMLIPELGARLDRATRMDTSAARQELIEEIRLDMLNLKEQAGKIGRLSAWQLTSALEGLLKQLSVHATNVTASTLRTVKGGLGLLSELCVPDMKSDVLGDVPLQFLAVDDEPISRKAIALALKRAFSNPDVAENGVEALKLLKGQAYDAIFLDVLMPGMDGFELGMRIRETDLNGATPVIFVTCMSEFDARAESHLGEGRELLGKPFLTFEVAVKALTLAMRRRMSGVTPSSESTGSESSQSQSQEATNTDIEEAHTDGSVLRIADRATGGSGSSCEMTMHSRRDSAAATGNVSNAERRRLRRARRNKAQHAGNGNDSLSQRDIAKNGELQLARTEDSSATPGLVTTFHTRAIARLDSICAILNTVSQAQDPSVCADKLAQAYLELHSLTPSGGDVAAFPPALRLCTALSGLLKKLLEKSEHRTPSALSAARSAAELLRELTMGKAAKILRDKEPFRMLVVDDDPISRRAMACALQMAFDKPECFGDGESALEVAAGRSFDVIFLDVLMPGMDGYEVCSKLRQSELNGSTPVVFVTSCMNADAPEKGAACGANDFIQKPFLTSEVTVKALTFALQNRLRESESQLA